MTTQTEMYEQTQAFPRSTLEILEQLRGVHATELDRAIDTLDSLGDDEKIAKRYDKAEEKVAGCRELLRNIDKAIEELRMMENPTAEDIVRQMQREAVESGTTVTLSAGGESVTFSADVDPITDEVDNRNVGKKCPDCQGDGRLPDKTGGGHHRCKKCEGTGSLQLPQPEPTGEVASKGGEVLVAWPDNLDMQTIDVGPLTRYGELAAKFLNSLPGDDPRREDSFLDYRIVDVDAGTERDPHATIVAADYGLEFSFELGAKAEEGAA